MNTLRMTNRIRDIFMVYGYSLCVFSFFWLAYFYVVGYFNDWVVVLDMNHYSEGIWEFIFIVVLGVLPALYYAIISFKYILRGNYIAELRRDDDQSIITTKM